MAKTAMSARGEIVDFDLLAITQALASAPVPVSVDERRKFINEKDGVRAKNQQATALDVGVNTLSELIDDDDAIERVE